MKKSLITPLILVFITLLASCTLTSSHYRTPSEQATSALQDGIRSNEKITQNQRHILIPRTIERALIPGVSSVNTSTQSNQEANIYTKHYNINVSNVEAQRFFQNLGKETTYSIVVDPNVTGTISINLKNVTVTELFQTLHETYGFDYRQTAYGFKILPPKLETRSFHVNYLDINRNSSSYTQISADQTAGATTTGDGSLAQQAIINNGQPVNNPPSQTPSSGASKSQVNTTSTINFWTELTDSLKALVGKENGRSVIVNPSSGTVIVKGFPQDIRQVNEFIDHIQTNMSREVVLEVKLLEVTLNDQFNGGINWSVFGFNQQAGTAAFTGTTGPLTTINIHNNSFSSVIQLLQQQGDVQTIANPRVLTINNQQAVIRIGNDQYFVTGITTNTNNTGTGTNTVTTASVNLQPFFSGVILDITPQISNNGQILLHLHPVVSSVTAFNQSINIGNPTNMILPVANSDIREYDSIVRAEDQQVILVGGLTQNTLNENIQSTPMLGKIPFLGMMFRSTVQSSQKTELVILLKPTITGRGNESMAYQLPVAASRISELGDNGFHEGPLLPMFGNQGEKPSYDRSVEQ